MRQLKITASITDRDNLSLDKYLSDVSRESMISYEEEVELARRIKQGDEAALEKLVRANLRFVVSVAKQYQGQGMPLTDMISEGNLGLIKAAERFDEKRGFKFISYAVWWIRQSIMSSNAQHSRTVRLPLNQVNSIRKIRYATRTLEQQQERQPTSHEIASYLEESESAVKDSMSSSLKGLSIDAPMSEDEDFSLSDRLTNGEMQTDAHLDTNSLRIELGRGLDVLTDTEAFVLRRFFGIDQEEDSLTGIAHELDLSKERVRQIKNRALKTLSHKMDKSMLSYL